MRPAPLRLGRLAVVALVLAPLLGSGCGKKADSSSSSSSSSSASNLPVKGPWDALKITASTKKAADGSPLFIVENTGSKTVNVVFMDFYAYDAKGAELGKKDLSYNRTLKGGDKDDNVSISDVKGAVSWDATYHGIEFDGDASPTMDYKRAPDKKPKGK